MNELTHLTVEVAARSDIDGRIAVLDLVPLSGQTLPPFTAGAHIDVHIDTDLIRQYSLCNAPSDRNLYRLAVMEEPASRGGSRAIFHDFHIGKRITISEPRNLFELNQSSGRVVLLAAGIGITPIYSMAQQLLAERLDFELHYCLKEPGTGAFEDEIKSLLGERANFHYSRVAGGGRLDLKQQLMPMDPELALYICGPAGFLEWAKETALAADYRPEQIHYEYFNVEVELSGGAFEVYCSDSDITVQVGETDTIAGALKAVGIKVAVSCEEGVCGTCITDVLEGEPEHRDHFLSEDEKEDNDQIAVCCSRAKSKRLVLDI